MASTKQKETKEESKEYLLHQYEYCKDWGVFLFGLVITFILLLKEEAAWKSNIFVVGLVVLLAIAILLLWNTTNYHKKLKKKLQ